MDAQKIKDRITVPQVLRQYGYLTSRNSRIPCPLHRGNNPSSFRFGDKAFYCYSCQEHGDVIALIMKLFNFGFMEAIQKLESDFYLGPAPSSQSNSPIVGKMVKRCDEGRRKAYLSITESFAKLFRMNADPEALCEIEDWLDSNLETFCYRKDVELCKE
jgi:DNA primase